MRQTRVGKNYILRRDRVRAQTELCYDHDQLPSSSIFWLACETEPDLHPLSSTEMYYTLHAHIPLQLLLGTTVPA